MTDLTGQTDAAALAAWARAATERGTTSDPTFLALHSTPSGVDRALQHLNAAHEHLARQLNIADEALDALRARLHPVLLPEESDPLIPAEAKGEPTPEAGSVVARAVVDAALTADGVARRVARLSARLGEVESRVDV